MTMARGMREATKATMPEACDLPLEGTRNAAAAPTRVTRSIQGSIGEVSMRASNSLTRVGNRINDAEDDCRQAQDHADGVFLQQAALGGLERIAQGLREKCDE